MIRLGRLAAAERRALYDTMTVSHRREISARLMTLNYEPVLDVSDMVVDGQVDYSHDGTVSSSASITMLDPGYRLGVDSPDAFAGQVSTDRLLRIETDIWVPGYERWYSIPLFTGRITKPIRQGPEIELACQGMEAIATKPAWGEARTWRRNTPKTDIIRALLIMAGIKSIHIDIPDLPGQRTAGRIAIKRGDSILEKAHKLAASMDMRLFADARGEFQLRGTPNRPAYVFADGPNQATRRAPNGQPLGATVIGEPKVTHDTTGENFINTVWVVGAAPRANKPVPVAIRSLPPHHPLSPQRNAMNGVPEHRYDKIDDDTIRTRDAAHELADKRVNRLAREYASIEAEVMPIPGLEPGDVVALATVEGYTETRLRSFSYPLVAGSNMSLGARRRVRRRRVRSRR